MELKRWVYVSFVLAVLLVSIAPLRAYGQETVQVVGIAIGVDSSAKDIAVAPEGDVYVVGYNFVARFDSGWNLKWLKRIGGTSNANVPTSIADAPDGNIYIAGGDTALGQDVFVAKLDNNGNLIWYKTIGDSERRSALVKLAVAPDGYIYVTGFISIHAFVAKLDSNGNLVWFKTIGGSRDDYGHTVAVAPDGSVYVVGVTASYSVGWYDVFVAKLDSSGNLLWFRTIGGSDDEWGYSIAVAPDGSIYVVGSTRSFGAGDYDVFVAKLNSDGELLWFKTIGTPSYEEGLDITVAPDGSMYIGGTATLGAFLAKIDSSGNLLWLRTVDGGYVWGVAVMPCGCPIIAGFSAFHRSPFVACGYTNEVDLGQVVVQNHTDDVFFRAFTPYITSLTPYIEDRNLTVEDFQPALYPIYGVGGFEKCCPVVQLSNENSRGDADGQLINNERTNLGGYAEPLSYEYIVAPVMATTIAVLVTIVMRRRS